MHRAETIMQALLTRLTGLTTTGSRVERGHIYPVDALPALTLEMGSDDIALQNIRFIDRTLTVRVIAHVKTSGQFDTALNTIKEEVHIALMTDRTQGLPGFVIDTITTGDDAPEVSGEAEQVVGRQQMNWQIKYRHAITNPGA